MDKMTVNMIAGAVLSSLLVIFGMSTFINIVYPKGGAPEAGSHSGGGAVAGGGKAAGGGAAAPAEAGKPVGVLLASADAKAGEAGAKKCATCHTFEAGGPNKVGPNLHGIVGRPVGKHEGFSYSPAIAGKGGNWDYDLLNCYLADPKACIPGNKMAFAGLKKDSERADVIAYLRTITDNAPPLPAAEAKPSAGAAPPAAGSPAVKAEEKPGAAPIQSAAQNKPQPGGAAPAQPAAQNKAQPEGAAPAQPAPPQPEQPGSAPAQAGKSAGALLASGDAKAGEAGAKKCAACHSFEAGGANKIGPNLHGIVGRPVGKHEGFSYSPAMAGKGGNWDYELLNCYLTDPKACIPGNKMAFPGLKKDSERADVIAYLRTITDNAPPLPAAEAKPSAGAAPPAAGSPAVKAEEKPAPTPGAALAQPAAQNKTQPDGAAPAQPAAQSDAPPDSASAEQPPANR